MPSKKNTSLKHLSEVRDFKCINRDRIIDGLRPLDWSTWQEARRENSAAWELEGSGVPRKTVLQMVRE